MLTSGDLVLETGSGLTGANTYASLSGASGYHAGLGRAAWDQYTNDEQAQALVDATRYMGLRFRFVGNRLTSGQALDWPRLGAYDADGYVWEEVIPPAIFQATCEYALIALSGGPLYPPRDTLLEGAITSRSETIGPHNESVSFSQPLRRDLPRYPEQDQILKRSGLIRGKRRLVVRGG